MNDMGPEERLGRLARSGVHPCCMPFAWLIQSAPNTDGHKIGFCGTAWRALGGLFSSKASAMSHLHSNSSKLNEAFYTNVQCFLKKQPKYLGINSQKHPVMSTTLQVYPVFHGATKKPPKNNMFLSYYHSKVLYNPPGNRF